MLISKTGYKLQLLVIVVFVFTQPLKSLSRTKAAHFAAAMEKPALSEVEWDPRI
jgi:hypothetical protein